MNTDSGRMTLSSGFVIVWLNFLFFGSPTRWNWPDSKLRTTSSCHMWFYALSHQKPLHWTRWYGWSIFPTVNIFLQRSLVQSIPIDLILTTNSTTSSLAWNENFCVKLCRCSDWRLSLVMTKPYWYHSLLRICRYTILATWWAGCWLPNIKSA
jgi:hypothetical protein